MDSFFELDRHRTSISTEVIAGISSFLATSYIIVVNPAIPVGFLLTRNQAAFDKRFETSVRDNKFARRHSRPVDLPRFGGRDSGDRRLSQLYANTAAWLAAA